VTVIHWTCLRVLTGAALFLVGGAGVCLAAPTPTFAVSPATAAADPASGLGGGLGGAAGLAGGLGAGGGPGGVAALGGPAGLASSATTALALSAVGTWVLGGARFVLDETGHVLGETTAPRLTSTWFSSTYWRVAAIASVLTLPFLFAAAVQALMSSDITLLIRAAFGYLPLAALAVTIAAPLAMLLLAASDQLAGVVSSAAGQQGAQFLVGAGAAITGLTQFSGSPFIAFFVGVFTVAVAVVLWLELLIREAAVYVIVLLLPLAFAALVWPARRIWAIRSVELLLALILSKFAIVAVLSLGGAALGHSVDDSATGFLAGAVLLILAAFAPWALLRLLPLTELAGGPVGTLRHEARTAVTALQHADVRATQGHDWASKMAQLRESADEARRDAAVSEKEKVSGGRGSGEQGLELPGQGTPTSAMPPAPADPRPTAAEVPADPRPAPLDREPTAEDPPPRRRHSTAEDPSPSAEYPPGGAHHADVASADVVPDRSSRSFTTPGPALDLRKASSSLSGPDAADRDPAGGAPDAKRTNLEVSDPTPPSQPPDEGRL
jgi:hypothetical protein